MIGLILLFSFNVPDGKYFNEICIYSGPGNQLTPDVEYDGQNFWVVWADENSSEIYGRKVTPNGDTLNTLFFPSYKAKSPSISFIDTIGCVNFVCDSIDTFPPAYYTYNLIGFTKFYTSGKIIDTLPLLYYRPSFGFDWNIRYIRTFSVSGKNIFLSLADNDIWGPECFSRSEIIGNRNDDISQIKWIEAFNSWSITADWNGKNFLVIWDADMLGENGVYGAFIEDTLTQQQIDTFLIRDENWWSSWLNMEGIKTRELIYGKNKYFLVSQRIYEPTIYFDILSDSGLPIDSLPTVIDNGDSINQEWPSCAYKSDTFFAVWQAEKGSLSNLYGILVDTNSVIIDSNYINPNSFSKIQPSVATDGNKFFLVWADNRNGNFDICGAFINTIGLEESSKCELRNAKLEVYPNPLYQVTSIRYQVASKSKASLKIYDVSGKLVNTLVDEEKRPGPYTVRWDAKEVTSGVYFIKFNAGDYKATKKLILIKPST